MKTIILHNGENLKNEKVIYIYIYIYIILMFKMMPTNKHISSLSFYVSL